MFEDFLFFSLPSAMSMESEDMEQTSEAGGSGKMTSRLSPSKALATVRRGLSGKNHDSIFFLEFHFFLCSDSMLVPQRLPSKSPSSPSHFLGIKRAMRDVRRRLRRREGWRKSSRL